MYAWLKITSSPLPVKNTKLDLSFSKWNVMQCGEDNEKWIENIRTGYRPQVHLWIVLIMHNTIHVKEITSYSSILSQDKG